MTTENRYEEFTKDLPRVRKALEAMTSAAAMFAHAMAELGEVAERFERPGSEPAPSATEPCPPPAMADQGEPPMAPREQWPQIGETTSIEFVAVPFGHVLRCTVEIPCHQQTASVAADDFVALHPLAPGVHARIAEMATHAPTMPPPTSAEFAPDHEAGGLSVATVATMFANGDSLPASDDTTAADSNAPKKRTKNEYTAKEWAESVHFLNYMKKHPFKGWPVEQQTAMRDRFVEEQPADLKMNRWGERFAKFCGVSA